MANIKSLSQVGLGVRPETVRPNPAAKMAATPAHSKHNEARSKRYHATVTGGNRASDRGTARLNPNPSVAKANTQGRTFPGLAN